MYKFLGRFRVWGLRVPQVFGLVIPMVAHQDSQGNKISVLIPEPETVRLRCKLRNCVM